MIKTLLICKNKVQILFDIFLLFNEASSNSDYTVLRFVSNELQCGGRNDGDLIWSTIPGLAY
jgi:hypothetical protein